MIRFAVLSILLLSSSAAVQAGQWGGRGKLDAFAYDSGAVSPEAALGYEHSRELSGELRLAFREDWDAWQFNAAAVWTQRHGTAVARDRALTQRLPALTTQADTSYWDLDHLAVDGGRSVSEQRLDRLNLGYTGRHLVLRLGRQALTWGNGLVFHPVDLVNPFQPVATDTAYKRGTDMLYGQWLFDDGSDLQAAFVPHRSVAGIAGSGNDTSAVLFNLAGGGEQYLLLAARDYGDSTLALGASGAWGDAAWTFTAMPTRVAATGKTRSSWIGNLSDAVVLGGRNVTLFAELYHNGFGHAGRDYSLAELAPALQARLQRGQRFVTGRNYLALGGTLEWTPLLQFAPSVIANLADHSLLVDLQVTWSLSDNTNFKAGVRSGIGPHGTEFGGLPLAPGSDTFVQPAQQVFVRLERYF